MRSGPSMRLEELPLLSVGGRNMNKTCAMGYGYSVLFRFYLIIKKLLRAAGLFAGSILLMRNYGDLMAI
ncbi:hypothetical protein HKD37_17G047110 [Glycine soja]